MKPRFLIILVLFISITFFPDMSYSIGLSNLSNSYDGDIIYVGGNGPGNYTKIQDAIDNASDGDTVFVFNGLYDGGLIVNKSISLIGENKSSTYIEGTAGPGHNGISIYSNQVHVIGFNIQNIGQFWPDSAIYINSNDNIISDNIITNNKFGIDISDSDNNLISQNLIINQDRYGGIYMRYSSNNIISKNIISNNNDAGINLLGSYNNSILENIISNHRWGGIVLLDQSNTSNIIYHNNLINNVPNNAADIGFNNWDNDFLSEGNYWDDYKGEDSDGDGIGDIPYNISGAHNQDRYPLIKPYKFNFAEFEIEISGGIGTSVNIKNIGKSIAYDIKWTVEITGGLLKRINLFDEGNLDILNPGNKIIVELPILISLGNFKITATVGASNSEFISKTKNGLIFLFVVILK